MTVNFCCELRRFELTVFSLSLLESLICYMSDCGGKTNLAKFFFGRRDTCCETNRVSGFRFAFA